MQTIYLDNNATTLMDPMVAKVVGGCWREWYANPASQHRMGQRARNRLQSVRQSIVELLGGQTGGLTPDQLLFTSGGTESNHLALIGLALDSQGKVPPNNRILISSIEHPSILGAAQYLQFRGFQVEVLGVDSNGVLDVNQFQRRLTNGVRLVSVMLANHETGVVQPLETIAELCRRKQVLIHTDAVQAVGKMSVNFSQLQVDALSFTAHKLHGPKGIGGLLLVGGRQLFPMMFGGFQQSGMRPGTEDVCLPIGMWTALKNYQDDADARCQRMSKLRDHLQSRLLAECGNVVVNGGQFRRTPNTLNVAFLGINRQEFMLAADMEHLAVSTGSACASGSSDRSSVLVAMGLSDDVIDSSIRISLSAFSTEAEVNTAADRIVLIVHRLRSR